MWFLVQVLLVPQERHVPLVCCWYPCHVDDLLLLLAWGC
jgi:hypothetical protein